MEAYSSLSAFYDKFTEDVPYEEFADYYEKLFEKYGLHIRSILDLACGTGTLTYILRDRGYDMIGADASCEMLSIAASKAYGEAQPLFLCQSADELDLYGTVDAVVCSLDGVNYIEPELLLESLSRVRLFMEPGGVFIFDINSPEKLRSLDGEMFLDETDDAYCVWRVEFDEQENACIYGFDLFTRSGNVWLRTGEEHIEYCYDTEFLTDVLKKAGFTDINIYGELSLASPTENEQRIFLTARKPG